jgi:hypothetical protein
MIANAVERRVTQAAIRQFEEALARLDEDARNRPEWIRMGLLNGMAS